MAAFAVTEVKDAVYPVRGSTTKVIQPFGYVHAMDLLLTARLVSAGDAAGLWLVNRVAPAGEPARWAIETAEMIAANSSVAVQAVKRLSDQHSLRADRHAAEADAAQARLHSMEAELASHRAARNA